MMRAIRALAGAAVLTIFSAGAARADEGMWLLSSPPTDKLKSQYGFEPSREFLEHMQKSCVRFSTGGSGSFVSANGLVMTNHHVGSDMLVKASTPERDLLKTGFYAAAPDQELKCPDLELDVLWTIQDVTARVESAVKPGVTTADANIARRAMMTQIEEEAKAQTGLTPQVVTLYQGGRYHLYCYRRYTDVRIVFAPEQSIAFFGGDVDNFEFPRYDLDVCFFRVYENGQPLKPEHYLRWSKEGSKEKDLALVFGHPGSTRRLLTFDHLKSLRDIENPMSLRYLMQAEVRMATWRALSPANAALGAEDYFGITNGRKFLLGQLAALQDNRVLAVKYDAEAKLRAAVNANPEWRAKWGDPWTAIFDAHRARAAWWTRYYMLERNGGVPGGELLSHARTIVRLLAELRKPSDQRLREFADPNLDSVYRKLYSDAPIHEELEIQRLATLISFVGEVLGCDDPVALALFGGESPQDRARHLIRTTVVRDIDARRQLVAEGPDELKLTADPLMQVAMWIELAARITRDTHDNSLEAVERENYAKIAAARFAVEGESGYPDATFTLRMAYGPIAGYDMGEGDKVPAYTTLAGLYQRAEERKGQEGFDLPQRWLDRKSSLDMNLPFNFVCSADIIGGNSGSPVVNTKGEVIGLIFDGNAHSLIWGILYDGAKGRAVSVDCRAIVEAMRKVYDAGTLVEEIVGK